MELFEHGGVGVAAEWSRLTRMWGGGGSGASSFGAV